MAFAFFGLAFDLGLLAFAFFGLAFAFFSLAVAGLRFLLGLARLGFGLLVVLQDRVDGQPLARPCLIPAPAIFLGPWFVEFSSDYRGHARDCKRSSQPYGWCSVPQAENVGGDGRMINSEQPILTTT